MPYWELIGTQNPSPLSCSLGVISEPKSIIFAWNSHLQCNELQRKLLCSGILGQGGRALTSFCLFVLNRVLEECEPGDLPCGWLPVRSANGTTCQNPFSVPGPPIKCVTSWTHLPLSHLALLSWVEVDLGQLAEKAAVSSKEGQHKSSEWNAQPHSTLGMLGCLEKKNRAQKFVNSLVGMPFWPTYQQGCQKVKRRLTNTKFPLCYPNHPIADSPVLLCCHTSCNAS